MKTVSSTSLGALRLFVLLAAMGSAPLLAQVPKAGGYFVDDSDLGYKIKMPKGWSFIPPKPNDLQLVGKYTPPNAVTIEGNRVDLASYLVKFDRRPGPDGETPKRRYKDQTQFLQKRTSVSGWQLADEGELKAGGVPVSVYVYEGLLGKTPMGAYAAVFHFESDLDLCFVALGAGGKKWSKYESAYKKMVKSLKRVEIKEAKGSGASVGSSPRDQKRAKLEDEIRRQPGWMLDETENYFFIYNTDDDGFVEMVKERIEAMRRVFLKDYPPASARYVSRGDDDDDGATKSVIDPMALSRTSVVRICAAQKDYIAYGGSSRANGHWSPSLQELVVFDKKQTEGSKKTLETLSHEAFHQYIFYFYGSISPHSWYNEGTGDYYGGFEYKRRKFARAPRQMRLGTLRNMLREDKLVPLQELVRYSQQEYYGSNPYGLKGYECYAQGWSLIYFLRLGKKGSRDWNESWEKILGIYLDSLVETADLDASVDAAFAGVDWAEFEKAWRKFAESL